MPPPYLISYLILWVVVLILAFLLVGTLRALGLLRWRLDQLEATTPSHVGRRGLRIGTRAPDFTLPDLQGADVALHDFHGRRVLLVFTQSGCSPCKTIVPELNRLRPVEQVLVVNNGELDETRKWSADVGARFPVVTQEKFSVSKKYQVFATPFAFLIEANGVIVSKGFINNRQHIRYVLSKTRAGDSNGEPEIQESGSERALSGKVP